MKCIHFCGQPALSHPHCYPLPSSLSPSPILTVTLNVLLFHQMLKRQSRLGSSEEEMSKCSNLADYHTAQLADLRLKIRQATVAAKQALEKQTREELLSGNREGLVGR